MKKLTSVIALILCIALCLGLGACGSNSSSNSNSNNSNSSTNTNTNSSDSSENSQGDTQASNSVTLVYGDSFQVGQNGYNLSEAFAERVNEATNGEVTIETHHAGTIGSVADVAANVMNGSVDFTIVGLSSFDSYYPQDTIMSAFFLFDDYDHLQRYMETDHFKDMVSDMEESLDIDVLGYFYYASRQFLTSSPVRTLDDLKGMKLRVAEEPMPIAFMQAIGAVPTPINISEVYTSVQNGTVNGLENGCSTIIANNFQEVCDYLTITNHQVSTMSIIMSEATKSKLTDEQYEIICQIAEETCQEYDVYGQEAEQEDLATLAESVTIIEDADLDAIREACQAVYDSYDDTWGEGNWEYIRSLAG